MLTHLLIKLVIPEMAVFVVYVQAQILFYLVATQNQWGEKSSKE